VPDCGTTVVEAGMRRGRLVGMTGTFTIVGANLAGGRAAEALRGLGFDGRVIMIGAEPYPPYERPPLSKAVLLGKQEPDEAYLRPLADWADLDIELRLGARVTQLLPAERAVGLAGGEHVPADKVLLCTGGRPRRLAVEGAELAGVHYLRDIDDALAVRAELVDGASVVVVGAGFIGAEVAACARESGCEVTVLEVAEVPLWRVLGRELGQLIARAHRDRGVDLRAGVGVDRIEGDTRARAVVSTDGRVIEADVVVVGVGIDPATELAELAGIETGNGILVDELCRTSLEGVYAAGDVASHPNPILGERLRLEHWQNAQNQAMAAARSMLGGTEAFAEIPWFWSDQYDLNLQIAGHPRATDSVVWRGDRDGFDFSAFYLRDGVLVGVVAVNRGREVRAAVRLIESRAVVAPEELADQSVDLRKIRLLDR
jgi:3-phenylpropionate/trans-cinnamate dioxygenase ferredoxin reductase component